ncbi:Transcription initiation protein SPT3-like protein [Operophtera brumata]|uniref:Transcription initiation protein SPT3-like protein n=1 Tax=Operophtera brumata TaxID=104452 RepID=A0A0L7LG43_OPEBR|nr:Transcription initiation protein SPT3-like protein [Operophtera brumata]
MSSLNASSDAVSTNFQKEISDMMHGFGDNPNPNPSTVVLVERIVLRQMRSLLYQAYLVAEARGSSTITNYEVIFVMRRNMLKLKQLCDYQLSLDALDKGIMNASFTEDELILELESKSKPRQRRNHIQIIEELDEINEIKHIKVNPLLEERKLRAVKLAETIPLEMYEAFHKAKCSSFRSGASQKKTYAKLEQWVNPQKELQITNLAMEVVGFIAYETVFELVDSVFKVRQDAGKNHDKLLSKLNGASQNIVHMKPGLAGCSPITEAEIREVVRRYFMPGGGMNGLFSRNMSQELPVRFIAF